MNNKSPKERLRLLLNNDEVYDFVGSQSEIEEGLVSACKDFLLSRDYKVVNPPPNNLNVRKVQDLCDRYYALANRKYSGRYPSLGRGKTFDLAIMKHFISSRMKDGVTRKVAMLECADILDTVFKYSEKMGLKGQITMSMFDPGQFSWVIDKALLILSGRFIVEEEKYSDGICEKLCDLGVDDDYWAMFKGDEDGEEKSSN